MNEAKPDIVAIFEQGIAEDLAQEQSRSEYPPEYVQEPELPPDLTAEPFKPRLLPLSLDAFLALDDRQTDRARRAKAHAGRLWPS